MSKHDRAPEVRATNGFDVAVAAVHAIKWVIWGAVALVALLTHATPFLVSLPGIGP